MARTIQRKAYRALPQDFSMLSGSVGVGALNGMPAGNIPALVNWEHTLCLPISNAQFDAFIASLQNLFSLNSPEGDCPGITTSARFLAVQSPTLICGMCVVAVGEGLNFCLPGVTVECPEGGAPGPAPAVPGFCDGRGAVPGPGQTPAVMQYGGVTWEFIEAFFRGFSLNVTLNDCLVLDLPVSDIGMCEIAPSFIGAGDSCVSVMGFVRETNQHARKNQLECQFLPVNTVLTTDCVTGVCTSICAPPPTASATWGHTMFTGRQHKIFKFPRMLPLFPAFSDLDISFEALGNNKAFIAQMRNAVVAGSSAVGAVDCGPVGPSECFTNESPIPGGCGPAVAHWPGGKVTIGVRLLGFRLSYSLCVDWITTAVRDGLFPAGLMQGMANNPFLQGLLGKMDRNDSRYATLAGLATGNLSGLPGAD